VPWILLVLGVALVWAGWDALIHLGLVRSLTDREVDRAVLGNGDKTLSNFGRRLARRWMPAHNSLEQLVACVFVLAGAGSAVCGAWLLWRN